ncbi:hypothetical protein CHS0354_013367 [Potamilus streckersoni]|uniref:Uncharacterized protein n=1 Tax=Potamilus streckersoni TaxID=2493646 RepID=A0AAE0RVZ0_9BIVA|nr:hypothetical protein CHS0354_013367 [Potamilus streckersoni]
MNPTQQADKDLSKWKEIIKETWDKDRKQVIIEGNTGIIYRMTLETRPTTQHIITVNLTNYGSDAHEYGAGMADTGHVMKTIGLAVASLLALLFIVILIYIRKLKNENKRISIRRPLQSEDPDHVYVKIEPLRTQYIESPSTSFEAVPIPIKQQKRWSGVTYVAMHINRLSGTDSKRSATKGSKFFNKKFESVQVTPPDFSDEDRKGKWRAACQTIQSTSRPLMDTDSQMLMTSSDVLMEMYERKNVCNPLTRQTESIPCDEFQIGNIGCGAQITIT